MIIYLHLVILPAPVYDRCVCVCVCVCTEQVMNQEFQKRLTAFERAGVENYLHWKRCQEENKIDKKADNMLQK